MLTTIAVTIVYQLMLLGSLPAIVQFISTKSLAPMRNWRLARTGLILMMISGAALYYFLYNASNVSGSMSLFVLFTAAYFAVTAGSYMESMFKHSVHRAEVHG